jgi:Ala-tRNA(Pro) deacylase
MITNEKDLLKFMDEKGIEYEYIAHPPVYTCEEAERLRPETNVQAVSTKNLFVCDKKGREFFLVVTACEKRVNLKTLAVKLGVHRLRFASERNLEKYLGVGRGAVTMLGLVNNVEGAVELWVDEEVWGGEVFLCHPLVNTSTLVMNKAALEVFFALVGAEVRLYQDE